MSLVQGDNIHLPFAINQTDTLAGTSHEIVCPVDGFVDELHVIVQADVTTGGSVKVTRGASTDVVGANVTVADADTKGTVYSAESTKTGTSRHVSKGDRLQVVPSAGFDTAGAINGVVVINTAG